ncbi:MAG: hypothetical protein PHD97_08075 [Bacteroidales bacterium]|nr:hypothetical protein [Bacteroidales bacterium]
MTKKIKIPLLILQVLFIAFFFLSCNKGDHDSWLSFRSRKARLAGDWVLKRYEYTFVNSNSGTQQFSYDGTYMTETVSSKPTISYSYSETMTIRKDGTFIKAVSTNKINVPPSVVSEGRWFFMGKNKDLDIKKKEEVFFQITKETITYSASSIIIKLYSGAWTGQGILASAYGGNGGTTFVWELDRLSNKKIEVLLDASSSTNSSTNIIGTAVYEQ